MRISFRRLSPLALLAFVASAFALSCMSDPSGPSYQPGYLALAPSFESSASGVVDVDSVHVILIRDADSTVALDTVVALTTDSDSVDLSFSVPVSSSSETFTLTLDCLSPTGEVVFSAGPMEVTATTAGSDNVVAEDVPITYVGVGSDAADINVPGDDIFYIHMSDTLTLEALALDSSGATISGTPIKWTSDDTTLVRFPDPAVGRMEAGQIRGWVDVTAELLTGPTDIVEVYVEPVPSEITIYSGDNQTSTPGTQLPVVLEVQVNAPDGFVEGSMVDFTTLDGGSFGQASMATDASGYAWTTWTLGQSPGQQTTTATVRAYPALQATFTASSETPPASVSWTNVNGGNWSEPSNWSSGSVPSATDTAVIGVGGTYTVVLDTDATIDVLRIGTDYDGRQSLTVNGTSLTINTAFTVGVWGDLQSAGTIAGAAPIDVYGTFRWTGGAVNTDGLLSVRPGGTLLLIGTDLKSRGGGGAMGGAIRNDGVTEWIAGDLSFPGPDFENTATGRFGAFSNGSMSAGGFSNYGRFEKDSANTSTLSLVFSNWGVIHIGSDSLMLNGSLFHYSGGLLSGVGTLDLLGGTVNEFDGDLGPGASPGVLTIAADLLPLGTGSTFRVELDGTSVGTEYDHLNVVGDVGLAGTLDITMGFTPSIGDSFTVLDFVSTSGSFTNINGLDIGGGMALDTIWGTNSLTLEVVAAIQTGSISWTGNGDGTTWSDATNWSLGRIPNTTDTVAITLDGTYTVTVDAPTTVYALEVGGTTGIQTLSVANQTLTVDSAATFGANAVLDMSTGTLDGLGMLTASAGASVTLENSTIATPITNNGTLVAHGQSTSITGTYVSGPGSMLRVEGYAANNTTLTVSDGFVNNGAIELTNNTISRHARLNVTNGTLVNSSGSTLDCLLGSNSTVCDLGAALDNQGAITVARQLTIDKVGATHTNSGTITFTGGASMSLSLSSATFTNSGTIDVSDGGGIMVTGLGTDPAFTNSGTINLREFRELRVSNGTFNYPSGTINGPGILRLNYLTANIDVAIDNTTLEFASNTITVNGTGSITNAPGQTLTLTSSTVNIPFTNNGTFVAVNDNTLGGAFVNNGTTEVQTGTLTFAGDFTHADGAVLQGNGTIDFSTTNFLGFDGDVSPGSSTELTGILSFIGDAIMSPLTTSNIEIGGLVAGTDYDRATVTGAFTADGTLNVSIINGFTPVAGNTFTVLTFTSQTGDFATYTGMDLGGGLVLEPQWNSTSLDLVVTETVPGQILFAGDSAGGLNSGIFTANSDGTGLTRPLEITSFGDEAVNPRWSPNRERIAFTERTGGMENLLYMMHATGDTLTTLVSDTSTYVPRWSPNGSHLAFECGDGWSTIDVCVIPDVTGALSSLGSIGNGTGKVYVTDLADVAGFDPAEWNNGPWTFAWDPLDNDRIAVVRDSAPVGGAAVSQIFTMRYDGTEGQPLTSGRALYGPAGPLRLLGGPDDGSIGGNLDWSPDGQWLVFSAIDTNGQRNIYRISRYGSQLTQLTNTTDSDDSPRWSPTGNEIMFGRDQAAGCDYDLWIMDADGGSPHAITAEHVCDYQLERLGADWSPDGQQIALTGFESPYSNLFIYVIPRTTTAATYFTDRAVVGPLRGSGAASYEVTDIQPSWKP